MGGSWGRLIPANREERWPNYYKCLCGNNECKATTVAICNLDHIRGHVVVSMPVRKTRSSCVNTAAMKMKKLGCWKSDLQIESYVFNEIRDNQKIYHAEAEQPQTRAQQKETERSLRYVAELITSIQCC
jgi:hypothetical protein